MYKDLPNPFPLYYAYVSRIKLSRIKSSRKDHCAKDSRQSEVGYEHHFEFLIITSRSNSETLSLWCHKSLCELALKMMCF